MTNTTQNLEKTLHKLHHLTSKMNCANILIIQLEELLTKSYYRGYYDGFKNGYDDGEKHFSDKCGMTDTRQNLETIIAPEIKNYLELNP